MGRNSASRKEETSLLSVQVEDTNEEHISIETNQMLETDAMLLGVVNENAEEEDVEPGEESEEEEVDERASPQLELPEIPGAGEDDWEIDRDCREYAVNVRKNLEKFGENFEEGDKDSEEDMEELEPEEGDRGDSL